MSLTQSFAHGVARGGRGLAWVFLVPVIFIGIYVSNSVIAGSPEYPAYELVIADASIAVACLLLWYFVMGRIHDWRAVRNVRGQVPDAILCFGISARAGSGRSPANVMVATPKNLQLWIGQGDSARPMATWNWSTIGAPTAQGGDQSSWISVPIEGDAVPLTLAAVESRPFATFRVRGRARVRLIDRLDEIRLPAPPPSYKVL